MYILFTNMKRMKVLPGNIKASNIEIKVHIKCIELFYLILCESFVCGKAVFLT